MSGFGFASIDDEVSGLGARVSNGSILTFRPKVHIWMADLTQHYACTNFREFGYGIAMSIGPQCFQQFITDEFIKLGSS